MNNFENFIKNQESTDMFEKIWPTIKETMDNFLNPELDTENGVNITLLGEWIEKQIVKKYEEKELENILQKEPQTPPMESSVEKEPQTLPIESSLEIFTPNKKRKITMKKGAINEEKIYTQSDESESTDDSPFIKSKKNNNTKNTKKTKKRENKKSNIIDLNKKDIESLKGLATRICDSISTDKNPSTYMNQEKQRIEKQIILKSNENVKVIFHNMVLQDQFHLQQISDAFEKQSNATFDYYQTLLKAYQSKENQIDFFWKQPNLAQNILSVSIDTQSEEKSRGKVSLLLVNYRFGTIFK